jgi:hypothetical protein
MMRLASIIFGFAILTACDKPNDGLGNHKSEVGRFAYYPPVGEMPAVLLDTITGCVEMFEPAVSEDNPKDVAWWRRYSDFGVPLVTYENGKVKEVPNSAPPQRCAKLKDARK